MRALTLVMTAIATAAGFACAGILKVPLRLVPQSSKLGIVAEHSFSARTGRSILIRNTLISYYACNISIGTPPQEYEVVVDTGGSFRLWLPGVQCDPKDPEVHFCYDDVRVGNFTIEYQLYVGKGPKPGFRISLDGFLGLSHQKSTDSLFYTMILSGLLDQPIFALYLSDNDHDDSEIIFGGTNKDHYHGNIVHLPVDHGTFLWAVDLNTIFFGDQSIDLDSAHTVLDSGTSSVILPYDIAQVINREIGGRRNDNGQIVIECDKREILPDLTFTLAGHNFTLVPSDYVTQVESTCFSLILGVDFESLRGPVVVLGIPFLRKWYTIYDIGNDLISLASPR